VAITAETTCGRVAGLTKDGVHAFRGIPFAAPPTGDLRLRPPRAPESWDGTREATEFPPAAPQLPNRIELIDMPDLETSEDCLYLNVWTPGLDDGRRPVMVWIHGGAFIGGAGATAWYNGTSFATRGDVVVVTLNYRLGVLGFGYFDEVVGGMNGTANLGILDQIAALEWVRDNIASFGGDPDQVTVFGESAGAMSIGTLLGTSAAKGLFKGAILQSGAARHVSSREEGSRIAREVLDELDLKDPTPEELRSLSIEQLLSAQTIVLFRNWGRTPGLPFQPVLDGVVLADHPHDAVEKGATEGMPLLVGTTRDEMLLFSLIDPTHATLTEAELFERTERAFRDEEKARAALKVYSVERPDATPGDLWAAVQTDRIFRNPALDLVKRHRGDAYLYLFTYCTPVMGGKLRSCHALEIPFVFNNLDAPGVTGLAGPVTPEMRELALTMHESWIAFAREGRPMSTRLPEWPTYTSERRSTMVFGDQIEVIDDPLRDERRLWDER
jgi:para-nitrobenzyl esterase